MQILPGCDSHRTARVADYLEWERQDYQQAVEAVRQGLDDVKAGRTKLAEQFLDDFADKHGLPR